MRHIIVPIFIILIASLETRAQTDTSIKPVDTTFRPVDSVLKTAPVSKFKSRYDSMMTVYSPKKAALRSALIPGWGQIYNKKYWKLPIVYGALGVAGGVFIYNLKNYRDTRFAYAAKYKATLTPPDTSDLRFIKPYLKNLDVQSLRFYRDEFRRNIDYSVLAFLLLWGLNVVDATVDAHLKSFDVSPDLSLRIKPGPSSFSGTTGLSLVLAFK